MRSLADVPRSIRRVAAPFSLTALLACGGGSGGSTNPPPAGGSFSLTATGAPISIARNGTGSVTITVARTGTFTVSVSLTAVALPTGVTVGFAPPQVGPGVASSIATISVGGAAAAGTFTLTVRGDAAGQNQQTVDIVLTIPAPPVQLGPFSLSMTATSHLVHPTNILSVQPVLTITRNAGFTGSVAFTASGLPPTLILGFTPSNTTGNTTTVVVLSVGATPNGTYTATVRGASAQGDQTITFQIIVAAATAGTIKWKYCSSSLPRFFFAVRDGNGPWVRIMPSAIDTSYSFSLTSGSGQVAEVTSESSGFRTTIHSYTATEMAARAASQCSLAQPLSARTANGSFGGVTGFRTSQVGMGWWFGSANGNGPFSLLNLPAGALDVVAVRNGELLVASAVPVDRIIIRRGVNPASGAALPVLDFSGAESFAPTSAFWTFGNTNGAGFTVSQTFETAGGTTGLFHAIPGVDGTVTLRTVHGVPLAQTINGDLHQVIATVNVVGQGGNDPARASRQIVAYSRTIADRTLDFGPALPTPAVSPIATAPAGRLRVQGTLPNEYNSGATFDVTQSASTTFFTFHATRGFLGAGNAYDIQMPDLTAITGWDSRFGIRAAMPVQWWLSGGGHSLDYFDGRYLFNSYRSRFTGAQTGVTPPADGATYLLGRATGTAVP
jgi:hypothetical protein